MCETEMPDAEESLYDLKIDFLEDGGACLEQSAGCGESHYVTLHRVHIRYLAERTGLIPTANPQARIKELEAALRLLVAAVSADGAPAHLRAVAGAVLASACLVSVETLSEVETVSELK